MKKIWIYGAVKRGLEAYKKYATYNNQQNMFAGFVDSYRCGQLCAGIKISELTEVPREDIIVISVASSDKIVQIYDLLRELEYNNIFLFDNERNMQKTAFIDNCCIDCSNWGVAVLSQAEMHVSDYCNLNCRGCTHYSPIFSRQLPDTTERIHDIELLASNFTHIVDFYLLGGEPFLNPDIEEYIIQAYELLPDTRLHIVTNGLLLPQISSNVFHTINQYNVEISISEYKPTHQIIDKVKDTLEKYNVRYKIRPYDSKQMFNKPLVEQSNKTYDKLCISDGCVNVWNGKIARCPSLMYVQELNKRFGLDLPSDGIYQLDGKISGRELKRLMQEGVPLCEHCVKNPIEWTCCGTQAKVTDFVEV